MTPAYLKQKDQLLFTNWLCDSILLGGSVFAVTTFTFI